MSAGMNLEEAKKVADNMSYTQAVYNALGAKGVPFRKATKIKLQELLEIAKQLDKQKQNLMIKKEKNNGKTINL